MVLSTYPRIWLGVFDYFVESGLKVSIFVYMHICFHVRSVLSNFVWFECTLYVYIYVYVYLYVYLYVCIYYVCFTYMYICMCIYIHVCSSVYIYASLYVCVGTHFCLYTSYLVNCLSCRYLGCYLSVWHCYLGSILAFSFKIVKLDTTICTKFSTQVMKINLGNINSLFPTLIVNNSDCIYLFIWINSDWLTDWLIDWLSVNKPNFHFKGKGRISTDSFNKINVSILQFNILNFQMKQLVIFQKFSWNSV